jgi:threonine dehydratase
VPDHPAEDPDLLPGLAEIEAAARLIAPVLPASPQIRWPLLGARTGAEVWLKHENHLPTGAFKIRGGLVYMDHLRRTRPTVKGVVAATRGNHGQSVALAAQLAGMTAMVVIPHGNSPEKNAAMRALGAELVVHGEDFQAALDHARDLAAERGLHFMPSFDPLLVTGVATSALELMRAVAGLDAVYVPIGLGSGVCGALAARNALGLGFPVVGVVSAGAPAYARSFAAGRAVSAPVTTVLADGMACRAVDETALAIVLAQVDRIIEVTDDEVADAMRALFSDTHNVAEGAGAAPLAALLKERHRMTGARVALIVSGANVDRAVFARVLAG